MTKPSNPMRSGGPRSAEGKLVASGNSLKTGAYSRSVILPGENPEEYENFLAGFVHEYEPQSATEMFLVQNMVGWMWKMLRLERLEAAAQIAELSQPLKSYELSRYGLEVPEGAEYYLEDLARIDAIDGELHGAVDGMVRNLLRQYPVTAEALSLAHERAPDFFRLLQERARDAGATDLTPGGLAALTIKGPGIDRVPWVRGALEELREEAALALWAVDNADRIRGVRAAISDARLQSMQHYVKPQMAFDHVSRSLYKAIDELRKHQTWRSKFKVIDVTPRPGGAEGG